MTPTFFFGRSLPFPDFCSIITKKIRQKNLYVGRLNYFAFTIHRGSNSYINTGVRDLKVTLFKANST